ncbi:MAG: hypothetical protein NDJ89_13410 [Oligoflexia bacterium]|nr:hypothetical protein [Oligoflexia bacterium]
MSMPKWSAYAIGVLLSASFMATGNAAAAGTCANNGETRLSGVEKDMADISTLLGSTPSPASPSSRKPAPCGSIDLRTKAQLHVKCMTSKGAIFERVSRDHFGEAWKGPDGVIWSDRVGSDKQPDAMATCRNLGGELPSKEDFARGEAQGFREVLPQMEKHVFWSSSFLSNSSEIAYFFNGGNGTFNSYFDSLYFSVRCVGR